MTKRRMPRSGARRLVGLWFVLTVVIAPALPSVASDQPTPGAIRRALLAAPADGTTPPEGYRLGRTVDMNVVDKARATGVASEVEIELSGATTAAVQYRIYDSRADVERSLGSLSKGSGTLPEEQAPVGRDTIGFVQRGGSIDRPRADGTTQHVELGCVLIIDVTRKVSASRCAALAPGLPVMVVAYRQEDFESALANKGQVETVYVPKLVPLLTWGLDHVEALEVP